MKNTHSCMICLNKNIDGNLVMSQPIYLSSTSLCAEWCYLYGQSLAFGGFICQHCCTILEEQQSIDLKVPRRKGASEKIQRKLDKQARNMYCMYNICNRVIFTNFIDQSFTS